MQELRTMGSMADMLMRFVSTNTVRDSNYEIAVLLLSNYSKVRHMTQKQMAELCFVSEASISRFCRFLGFENFHDFKAQMDQDFSVKDDYSRRMQRLMRKSETEAAELFCRELKDAVESTVTPQLYRQTNTAAKMIHDSQKVCVFSHHFLWDAGRFMQSKLMMMGKYVDVPQDYEMQKTDASGLNEKDLAVVLTIGGSWFSRYTEIYDRMNKSDCRLIVFTQNMSMPYLNRADHIIQCGTTNVDDTGKYCMMTAMDALVLNYLREYGEKNE